MGKSISNALHNNGRIGKVAQTKMLNESYLKNPKYL